MQDSAAEVEMPGIVSWGDIIHPTAIFSANKPKVSFVK